MGKSDKPYPGLGPWVLLLKYGDDWVPHCGANTREKLGEDRRKLSQWPNEKVKIIENVAPES